MKIGQSTSTAVPSQTKQATAKGAGAAPGSVLARDSDNSTTGQLIKGTVIAETNAGYLVKTESGVLLANSLIPLDIGRELWFVPLGGSGLAPASPQEAMPAILRLLLPLLGAGGGGNPFTYDPGLSTAAPAGQGAETAGAEVGNPLASFADYGVGAKPDPLRLLAFIAAINKNGAGKTSFADTIADLVGRESGTHAAKTLEAAGSAIKDLFEAHSQLNTQAQTNPQAQNIFLFPCFFAGNSGWGEWLFSLDKGKEQELNTQSSEYGISFYLTMSRLGEMHLQLTGRGKALQGQFSLSSRAAAAHVNANLSQLLPALEQLFKPVTLSCRYETTNNLQRIKDDLTRKSGTSEEIFALVDLTA